MSSASNLRTHLPPVNPLPFVALPIEAVRDHRLTPTDLRLLSVLIQYSLNKDHCWPSVKTLARDINRCERTVRYCLARLTKAGWVSTAPADNATGRVIKLVWRCRPPEKPRLTTPCNGAAAESERRERKRVLPPPTEEEKREFLTPLLSRPVNDPFRRFAQLRI